MNNDNCDKVEDPTRPEPEERPMSYEEMEFEIERLRAILGTIRAEVDEQAEDEVSWADAETNREEYLQEKLRKLHSVIEQPIADTSVTERLAEYAHVAWSGWLQYMFKQGRLSGTGELVIPKELALRWNRQMSTPYDALPDDEKNSDRQEARKMIAIFCKKQI